MLSKINASQGWVLEVFTSKIDPNCLFPDHQRQWNMTMSSVVGAHGMCTTQNLMKKNWPYNSVPDDWGALDWPLIGMLIYRFKRGNANPMWRSKYSCGDSQHVRWLCSTKFFIVNDLCPFRFKLTLIFVTKTLWVNMFFKFSVEFCKFTAKFASNFQYTIEYLLHVRSNFNSTLILFFSCIIQYRPGHIFYSLTASVVSIDITITENGIILNSFQVRHWFLLLAWVSVWK